MVPRSRDGRDLGPARALFSPARWGYAGLLQQGRFAMRNQNTLYLVIGALVVAVIALGIYVLNEESKPSGVELRIDKSGISVQEN
jgi:hypothetical protein